MRFNRVLLVNPGTPSRWVGVRSPAGLGYIVQVLYDNSIPYPGTEMFDYVKEHDLFLIPPEDYLNDVSEEEDIPVFETPEMSKRERIMMLKRCRKVRSLVMKNTAIRMYGTNPVVGFLIKYFFNVPLFEKLFFNNLFFRKVFEFIRYKKLVENRTEPYIHS